MTPPLLLTVGLSLRSPPAVQASERSAKGAKTTRATGLHLLAYFPRSPSPDEGPKRELLQCLEGIRRGRTQRVKEIVARCRKKGIQIAPEDVFEVLHTSSAPPSFPLFHSTVQPCPPHRQEHAEEWSCG